MAWDEKNRDEWAKQFLEKTFKETQIPLEGTEGATMSFFRVETKGDCALAMKGGKSQPIFELRIDLDWKVEQPIEKGRSILEAKGQIQVTDFSSEDSGAPQMKLICDNQLPPGATPAFQACPCSSGLGRFFGQCMETTLPRGLELKDFPQTTKTKAVRQ
ncbi:unnamed protein product [Symbiodinium sp. CCMP2592]|nr:unnamed protein product [Symbiodinium sp. CCMP2592]